jgi:hypothetical protein
LFIFSFVGIAVGAAAGAVLSIILNAARKGKNASDYGPRALIAEFVGTAVGLDLFFWCFKIGGASPPHTPIQWILFGLSMVAYYSGLGLSEWFAKSPEVSETPGELPTGFKSGLTSIHLND